MLVLVSKGEEVLLQPLFIGLIKNSNPGWVIHLPKM